MGLLQDIYDSAKRGDYAEVNPKNCGCRGGWFLSDVDTWHQCPLHGHGVPHPDEYDCPEEFQPDFDFKAHKVQLLREALLTFQSMAADRFQMAPCAFKAKVEGRLSKEEFPSPQDYVDAAEEVYIEASMEDERLRWAGMHPDQEPRFAEEDLEPEQTPDPMHEDADALDDLAARDSYYSQFQE